MASWLRNRLTLPRTCTEASTDLKAELAEPQSVENSSNHIAHSTTPETSISHCFERASDSLGPRSLNQKSLRIKLEDEMTQPLNFKRSRSNVHLKPQASKDFDPGTAQSMNISESQFDREVLEFMKEPLELPEMELFPSLFSKEFRSDISPLDGQEAEEQVIGSNHHHDLAPREEDENNSTDGYRDSDHDGQDKFQHGNLRIAGSRPPSRSNFHKARSRAASIASSFGGDRSEIGLSGYLFLTEIPPLPSTNVMVEQSEPVLNHSQEYQLLETKETLQLHKRKEKGKERSHSDAAQESWGNSEPFSSKDFKEHSQTKGSHLKGNNHSSREGCEQSIAAQLLKSPQHSWYLLRRLIGLELRWESERAWRMTILDSANKNTSESSNIKQKEIENRSINSHSSSDFESKEGSISSENLPILCFLVQRFILSFPIIHEQVTKTSKNLSSPVKANAPIYWNTGLLPLLRRLYKCDLSASIDLGTPGFLNAVCAFSGTKFIERLLATSLELVFKNASNLSGNRSNSIHLPYEGNSAQKIYEEARSNFFSKKYSEQRSIDALHHTERAQEELTSQGNFYSDKSIEPHIFTEEKNNEKLLPGFGKESQRISAISVQPSQRASFGEFSPPNSSVVFSSTPVFQNAQNLPSRQSHHAELDLAYEDLENPMGVVNKIAYHSSSTNLRNKENSESNLSSWLPKMFDKIESTPIDLDKNLQLDRYPDLNHRGSKYLDLAQGGMIGMDSSVYGGAAEVASVRETIQRLRISQGKDIKHNSQEFGKELSSNSRLSKRFSWKRSSDEKETNNSNNEMFKNSSSRTIKETSSFSQTDYHKRAKSDSNLSSPNSRLSANLAKSKKFNENDDRRLKEGMIGYTVDESSSSNPSPHDSHQVHYLHSGDSRFIAPETHKLQRSATSRSTFSMEKDSGEIHRHYQKRNERFYRYTKNSDQSTIEKTPNMEGTQSEALEQEKDESRTKGKRRFTLRLLTRRKSKEKSNSQVPAISSAESNIVRESSETQSINRGFLSSTPTDSPVESTSSLGEHKLKRVLTMALPESLMRQNPTVQENLPKDGFERHHEASTISIIKEPSQWPWGNPVPFWKGTPIHQVLWGGFEVNVAGVRSLAGRNKYILRIRRPLRLDEYVLRKESDFRKFFKALSKEFPQAHLRRLPARANRFDSKENDTEQIFEPGTERLAMRSEISAAAPTSTGHNNFEGSNIWENTNLDPTEVFSGSPYAQSSVKKDPDTIDNQKLESLENNTDGGKKPEVGKPSSSWSKTRRRNTLASLFVGGNHQSKFSFDTHSDHDDETNNAGFEKNYIETVKGLSSDKKKGSDDRHLSLYASFRSTKGLIEEHRRDLRSWLRDTLSIRNTGHHQETAAFLLLGSIVPTDEDLIDIRRRETIDEERRKKRTAEAQGAAERARVVHDWWKETKEDFFYGDGILNLSNALRQYSRVEQLPIKYQKSLEWMRMSFAEWLHELLISGDQSELFFKKLISFNEAFPWQMVKTALRIRKTKLMSNKMSEIFFSQKPNLGKRGRSVIQRMIGITISENDGDPTEIARRIHSCRSRIQSLTMCEKIIKYAYAPRDTKELFRRYSQAESLELVVTIVRSAEEPRLDKYDLERIIRASKSYASLLRKNGNRITSSMTENINVRLILDLKLYLRLISEERDAKQVREMLREDSTIGSLEIVVAPFAEFLKRTYKITNCVETIEDLRIFFQQLIVIVHALRSRIQDPQKSIRVLSRLLEKHQSSVYQWFHSVHIRDPTMAEVFQWLKSVVDLLKKGLTEPIVVSEIFSSVEDLGALEKELDSIVDWEEQKRKRKYEQVCRRYSADVDGDDAVIVEGDGFGKSKTEPLVEILTPQPSLDHIGCCLNYFRVAISKTLLGN